MPKLQLHDPIELLCNIAAQNLGTLDWQCAGYKVALSADSPLAFAAQYSSWNVDAENEKDVKQFFKRVRRQNRSQNEDFLAATQAHDAIASASHAEFLRLAAQQAQQDGLNGVLGICISFDKTAATAQRSVYPIHIRIVNIRDAASQKAIELLGFFYTKFYAADLEHLSPTEQKPLLQAHLTHTLNTVLERIAQTYREGVMIPLANSSQACIRLRPVIVYFSVDTPDAHTLCGTVKTWCAHCLHHESRADLSARGQQATAQAAAHYVAGIATEELQHETKLAASNYSEIDSVVC